MYTIEDLKKAVDAIKFSGIQLSQQDKNELAIFNQVLNNIQVIQDERNQAFVEDDVEESTLDKLERLSNLYTQGFLTDDEFARMKREIIG